MHRSVRPTPAQPRLLVVDDEPIVLAVLADGLRTLGFHTTAAADGAQAVALVRQESIVFDLALIDLRMPGMDGLASAAALRLVSPRLDCCLMGGGLPPTDEAMHAAGVTRFFPKPFLLRVIARDLLELVREKG
jgi:two-component system response regulator PrrA